MLGLCRGKELTGRQPPWKLDPEPDFLEESIHVLVFAPLGQIEARIDYFLPPALLHAKICLLVTDQLQGQLDRSAFAASRDIKVVEVDEAREDLPGAVRCVSVVDLYVHPVEVIPVDGLLVLPGGGRQKEDLVRE